MRIAEVFTNENRIGHIYTEEELVNYDREVLLGFTGDLIYLEVPDEIQEDWTYVNKKFCPPPEPEPLSLDQLKKIKKDFIANLRWKEETGGILVENIFVDTSRESRIGISEAAKNAEDNPEGSISWKTKEGFKIISSELMIKISKAVNAHVQACYSKESDLVSKIDKAKSEKELETINWIHGPAYYYYDDKNILHDVIRVITTNV